MVSREVKRLGGKRGTHTSAEFWIPGKRREKAQRFSARGFEITGEIGGRGPGICALGSEEKGKKEQTTPNSCVENKE